MNSFDQSLVIFLLYNQFIFVEKRQRGRFAGFSLYVSNTDKLKPHFDQNATLCYKDGPLLPTLHFKTTCPMIGRFVTFYNERFDKDIYPEGYEVYNIYTELCEVSVEGKRKNCINSVIIRISFFFNVYINDRESLSRGTKQMIY